MSFMAKDGPARIRKLINRMKWEMEKGRVALDYYARRYARAGRTGDAPPEFTIGIVTYLVRFDMFKTVLKRVRKAFPETPIVVVVNGYYDPERQRRYLDRMESFLSGLDGVSMVAHEAPQALCKLWNQLIIASGTEKILILNDDIDVAPHFEAAFRASGILDKEMAIINSSWSHFLIAKRTIEKVGWFDERLFGVGGEDWDYEARLAFAGVELEDVAMKGTLNLSIYTTEFSYGENVERVEKKYTLSSARFLSEKWHVCNPQDPQARYVRIWNDYVCLHDGFDTPVFYDFEVLKRKGESARNPGPNA
jgi:hypothetical protein